MWLDLIQKANDGGLDAIETYILWNAHEPQHRQVSIIIIIIIIIILLLCAIFIIIEINIQI